MRIKELVLDLFYPKRCPVCDSVLKVGEKGCCEHCRPKLVYVENPVCLCCGKPLRDETEEYCDDCRKKTFFFESGRALFFYNYEIRQSIMRFKYHGRREYGAFFGEEMYRQYGEQMRKWKANLIIPVPLHKKRERKRGYNQATEVAKILSLYSGIPMDEKLLLRTKETVAQKELQKRDRDRNVRDAFVVDERRLELYCNRGCVIIIDDIYTTGSTMNACAKVLKKSGIEKVYFLCVAIGKNG